MLTKEISEVEKGFEEGYKNGISEGYDIVQVKFDKFVEDLKLDIKKMSPTHEVSKEMLLKRIDELSSKQEGKDE